MWSWRNSKAFAEHTHVLVLNLNVTGVTELHVNGAVLNHINSVNTSNINVTVVIKNLTEQNKPCLIEKQRQRHLRIENKFPVIKRIWQINIRSHLPKPHHITHSQSWPILSSQGPSYLFSITLYQRSCESIKAERGQWGTARLLHMCTCSTSPSMIILNPRSPDSYLLNVHRASSTPA